MNIRTAIAAAMMLAAIPAKAGNLQRDYLAIVGPPGIALALCANRFVERFAGKLTDVPALNAAFDVCCAKQINDLHGAGFRLVEVHPVSPEAQDEISRDIARDVTRTRKDAI